MLKINLLPKEYQKRKISVSLEKTSLYVIAGGVAVLVLLAAYSLFFQVLPAESLNKDIQNAKNETQQYADEIKLVNDLNAKKNLILTRIGTIEELDRNRDAWVNIISDMGSRITEYLWLTKFGSEAAPTKPVPKSTTDQTKQVAAATLPKTTIEGRSFSLNSLATYIIRLKRSPFLKNIDLTSIVLKEETSGNGNQPYEAYHFVLQCDLVPTGDDTAETEVNTPADKLAAGSEF
jgi:Tfp pilus assembly protein PilN